MDIAEFHAYGYAAALLIGLGLGIEREHAARNPDGADPGSWELPRARTFPLIALAGTAVVTAAFGPCSLRRTVSMTYDPRATEPRAQHSKPGQAGDTR